MKNNISIYGHLTRDRILHNFEETVTLGAMANVWSTFIQLDSNLSIDLNPVAIGDALILINKANGTRVSRGNLNLEICDKVTPSSAQWHHIMYLNQLNNLDFIENIKGGMISADLCAGSMDIINDHLHQLDYLFISDEDLFMDIDELGKAVKGYAILHYPSGSYVTDGENSFENKTDLISDIDVLGAGDIFSACFIYGCLTDVGDLDEAIKYAHSMTENFLVKRKRC